MEEKALNLLSRGISQEMVARACGVDPSRISQLMADDEFRAKLAELRFAKMGEQSKMDDRYDKMESRLQEQFEKVIPMIVKPKDVLEAMKIINAMKRRTGELDTGSQQTSTVVQLTLPVAIMNKYQIKIDSESNRVIEAQGVPLLTAQSNQVVAKHEERIRRKGSAISADDL